MKTRPSHPSKPIIPTSEHHPVSPSAVQPSGLVVSRASRLLLSSAAILMLASPAAVLGVPEDHAGITSYTDSSTCMDCHGSKQHNDVMATSHWTWNHVDAASGQVLGKKNVINNFCIATASNEPRCTSCHIGVGWRDNTFNFTDKTKVDCLVCHDTTGTYKKTPTNAGVPDPTVNLTFVAQNAGLSSRNTCGACHFFGGGGDAVKHGDMDSSLTNPTRSVDVHMGTDGGNFTCARCHSNPATPTNHHDFVGTNYPSTTLDDELCQRCHTAPHSGSPLAARLDAHSAKIACQGCHIPAFARGVDTTTSNPRFTKMWWDWTTAGNRNTDGSQRKEYDADGNLSYDSMKGHFSWEKTAVPEFRWFNGDVTYVTLDTPVTAGQRLTINQFGGSINDPNARLFPVKRFTGKQFYDLATGKLMVPHLFPANTADMEAYWKSYDWDRAFTAGQAAVGRTYSGQRGSVETEMFWIQNHMVAPKENALGCADCHSPGGRIDFANLGYPAERAAALQSFYPIEVIAFEMATPGAGITLTWTTNVNYFRYQVQSSPNLVNWTNEANGKFIGGGSPQEFVYSDPAPEGSPAKKFYRVMRSTQ